MLSSEGRGLRLKIVGSFLRGEEDLEGDWLWMAIPPKGDMMDSTPCFRDRKERSNSRSAVLAEVCAELLRQAPGAIDMHGVGQGEGESTR